METLVKLACILLAVWFCTAKISALIPSIGGVLFTVFGVSITGLFLVAVLLLVFIGKIVMA